MTERVQIEIQAIDNATGILRGIMGQFGSLGKLISDGATAYSSSAKALDYYKAVMSDTTLNAKQLAVAEQELAGMETAANAAMVMFAETIAVGVVNGLRDSVQYTQQYVTEIHNLSLASGQSMEDTSRLVQVLDDYGLSAQDAMTATRALTKQGLAPSIDTVAQLADQYNKLGSAEAKNEFIMKNLGRAGMEWANALSQGGKALREQADAVQGSLIATQSLYDKTVQYDMAVDQLTDSWNAFKVQVGGAVIPVLTDVLTRINAITEAENQLAQQGVQVGTKQYYDLRQALIEEIEAQYKADAAARAHAGGLSVAEQAAKDAETATRNLSQANQTLLGNMFTIDAASETFTKGQEDRARQQNQIYEDQMRAEKELSDARLAYSRGTLTAAQLTESYDKSLKDLTTIAQRQKDLDEAGAEAIQTKTDASNKLIFSMLQQKAAQDGIVSSEETQFLMETAVKMGLVDQASAAAAVQASKTADSLWSDFEGVSSESGPLQATSDILRGIYEYNGKTVSMDVLVSFATTGIPTYTGTGTETGMGGGGSGRRAEGGPVYAGQSYIVGEHGMETFMPATNGTIVAHDETPRAGAQVTINITGIVDRQMVQYLSQEVSRAITQ